MQPSKGEGMQDMSSEHLIDANAAERMTGIKANTLRDWARKRRIASVKLGWALRFRISDLQNLMEERSAVPGARGPRGGITNPAASGGSVRSEIGSADFDL
jgi:hypothetical protein